MKTIKINDIEYKIKYTIRALFIFEQITGKPFEIKTLLDNYIFFYSMILANNKDNVLDWDEFINALDNDPNLILEFNKVNDESVSKDSIFQKEEGESGEKKNLSISELYAILTLQLHYHSDYVLDKMEMYEIRAAMKYRHYAVKDGWEQARLIAFLIAQTNSKQKLELQDILKFTWEEETKEEDKPSITKTEIERLKAKAEEYLKLKNNITNG